MAVTKPPYLKRSILRENWPANHQDYPNLGSAAFEDYEEGVWTPSLRGLAVAGTPTYSAQAGIFTRIGNLVFLEFRLVVTALGGATGILVIADLPYNHVLLPSVGNRPTMNFGFFAGFGAAAADTTDVCGFYQDTAVVRLIRKTGATATTYIMDTDVSGSITLYGSMIYRRN